RYNSAWLGVYPVQNRSHAGLNQHRFNMQLPQINTFPFSRREFLYRVGGGLSTLAFAPLPAPAGKAESPANNAPPQFPPKVLSFCAAKERQVQQLAKRLNAEVLSTVAEYFEAAKKGDWGQASDLFREARDLLHSSSASENQNTLDATASSAM